VTVSVALGLGAVVIAQGKIGTPEEYAKVMKANAAAAGAANKAIASASYADAKTQVATLRSNFMMLQTFWEEKKVPDAVAIVKTGLTSIDALDKALSAATPDQAAAQAALKQVQGTCGACHKTQREGDAQSGWKFKPGVF
jgi:cytochrome c556